jgi:hypothetical protein
LGSTSVWAATAWARSRFLIDRSSTAGSGAASLAPTKSSIADAHHKRRRASGHAPRTGLLTRTPWGASPVTSGLARRRALPAPAAARVQNPAVADAGGRDYRTVFSHTP